MKFVITALIGFLTTCSVSAQTGGWSSKVSPLLHKQVLEQQVAASRSRSGELTETYEADIVAATAGLDTDNEDIDKAIEKKLKSFVYNSDYLKELQAKKVETNDILSLMSIKIAFDYAKEHNMPCVVNCSWSTFQGYADRDDVVDEFLNKLTGPGRILVCSAGNEGDSYIYVEKPADGIVNLPNLPSAVYAVQCGTLGSSLIRM